MPKKKTQEEFLKEVQDKHGDEYTVLGEYQGGHTPIELKHNKCGHVWNTTAPYDFLKPKPNTCPECSHPSRRKSHETFVKEVFDLVGNEYEVVGKYTTNKAKINMHHVKCGKSYPVRPNSFLTERNRCPDCQKLETESKGVKKIRKILSDNRIKFEVESKIVDRYTKSLDKCLKYDFYLEELQLAIEFDGEQHFKPKRGGVVEFKKQQARDKRKDNYSKQKGIDLLRIPFWDEKNIKKILIEKFNKHGITIV